jgi:hypothetical protein
MLGPSSFVDLDLLNTGVQNMSTQFLVPLGPFLGLPTSPSSENNAQHLALNGRLRDRTKVSPCTEKGMPACSGVPLS